MPLLAVGHEKYVRHVEEYFSMSDSVVKLCLSPLRKPWLLDWRWDCRSSWIFPWPTLNFCISACASISDTAIGNFSWGSVCLRRWSAVWIPSRLHGQLSKSSQSWSTIGWSVFGGHQTHGFVRKRWQCQFLVWPHCLIFENLTSQALGQQSWQKGLGCRSVAESHAALDETKEVKEKGMHVLLFPWHRIINHMFHDLCAVFDPIKRDRSTRPRCMVQCICDAAAGKSPFWRTFVGCWFQGPDGISSVFQTHAHLWSAADAKGLYIALHIAQGRRGWDHMYPTSGDSIWVLVTSNLSLCSFHFKKLQ